MGQPKFLGVPNVQIFEEVRKFYNLGDKTFETDFSKVEDEFHFVIECPIYKPERLNLWEYVDDQFKNVAELQAFDKFIWLMSQENPLCTLKVAKFLQKANDMRQKEIQVRLLNE